MSNNAINVEITASTSNLVASMTQTTQVIQTTMIKVRTEFESVRTTCAKGLEIKTSGMTSVLHSTKEAVTSTRTSIEQYQVKLTQLSAEEKKTVNATKDLQKSVGDLNTKLQQAPIEKAKSGFSSLAGVMGKLKDAFSLSSIANAGLELVKSSIDSVKKMASEAKTLGSALGIPTKEAHVLNVALANSSVSSEKYISANKQIAQQLKNGTQAFDQYKIATKDAQGNLLPMEEIISNTAKRIGECGQGTERMVMGNRLLGSSWQDVVEAGKVTPEVMAAATKEIKDYHKELNPDMVDNYNDAIDKCTKVMESIKIVIGTSVMPYLTQLADWLGSYGPQVADIAVEAMNCLIACMKNSVDTLKAVWDLFTEACAAINSAISDGFSGEPISAMEFMVNCLKVTQIAFIGLRAGVQISIQIIRAHVMAMITSVTSACSAINKALHGDFSGAIQTWREGTAEIERIYRESAGRIIDMAAKTRDEISTVALAPANTTTEPAKDEKKKDSKHVEANPKKDNKKGADGAGGGKEKSRNSQWNEELEQQKFAYQQQQNAAGTFYEFSEQQEMAFWDKIRQRHDLNREERLNAEKKYYALSDSIRQKDSSNQIAALRKEQEQCGNNLKRKLELAQQEAAITGARYGRKGDRVGNSEPIKEDSKQYKESCERVEAIKQEMETRKAQLEKLGTDERKAIRLDEIATEEQAAEQELEAGEITLAQKLAKELAFQDKKHLIEQQSFDEEIKHLDEESIAYQQLKNKQLDSERKFLRERKALEAKYQQELNKPQTAVFKSMETAFSSAAKGILSRTMSLRQAMASIFKSVSDSFMQEIVIKPLMENATALLKQSALYKAFFAGKKAEEVIATGEHEVNQALQTQATAAGESARTSIQATSAGESLLIKAGSAVKSIMIDAWEALAGAFKAIVGIPIVGPALAVGAGAAAFAAVAGLTGNISSASGGYDIPSGVNPLTQLHQQEMVLPAKYANVIRDMAAGGGQASPSQGGGDTHHYSIAVTAMDSRDVQRALKQGGALHKALQDMNRRGVKT